MKQKPNRGIFVLALFLVLTVLPGCAPKEAKDDVLLHFADRAEGQTLLLSNEAYLEGLTQNDLNFRMQKLDATLEEYKEFAAEQVLDFTEEEKNIISEEINRFYDRCREQGYHLPELDQVTFVKTTSANECNAGAYTQGTTVYLGVDALKCALSEDKEARSWFSEIIPHELFHCFTRTDPEFRTEMYSILGFTVQEEDFVFEDAVRERIISNPDVEHHNSYATFRINGEDIPCAVVFTTEHPFEKKGDSFFDSAATGLVPIDDLNTMYSSEEAENFWDVFGRNTDYVVDPEETLADNFAFTILNRDETMKTPELLESIRTYLRERA